MEKGATGCAEPIGKGLRPWLGELGTVGAGSIGSGVGAGTLDSDVEVATTSSGVEVATTSSGAEVAGRLDSE